MKNMIILMTLIIKYLLISLNLYQFQPSFQACDCICMEINYSYNYEISNTLHGTLLMQEKAQLESKTPPIICQRPLCKQTKSYLVNPPPFMFSH